MASEKQAAIGHYSAKEVARLAGVSPRRVGSSSTGSGIIPSVSKRPRVFCPMQMAGEAVSFPLPGRAEFRTATIREIVENLRKESRPRPLANAPLKHDGRFAVTERGDDVYIDAADGGDQRVIAKTLLDLKAVLRITLGTWRVDRLPTSSRPHRGRPGPSFRAARGCRDGRARAGRRC